MRYLPYSGATIGRKRRTRASGTRIIGEARGERMFYKSRDLFPTFLFLMYLIICDPVKIADEMVEENCHRNRAV